MLDHEHPGGKRVGRITLADGYRCLGNDWARVSLRNDEMNSGTGNSHAGPERLAVRVDTGKRRQQRRVDIEHAPLPLQHKVCREQPHEATEADEFNPVLVKHALKQALESRPIRSMWPVIDDRGRHASLASQG